MRGSYEGIIIRGVICVRHEKMPRRHSGADMAFEVFDVSAHRALYGLVYPAYLVSAGAVGAGDGATGCGATMAGDDGTSVCSRASWGN